MASNWQETYRKLKKKKETMDLLAGGGELAPIKTTKTPVTQNISSSKSKNNTTKVSSTKKKTTNKVTTPKKKEDKKWWQEILQLPQAYKNDFDLFDDGWDFGDGIRTGGRLIGDTVGTILGTTADVGLGAVKGVARVGEDLGALGGGLVAQASDWVGADNYADKVRKNIASGKQHVLSNILEKGQNALDDFSVIGKTGDKVTEGVGQLGAYYVSGGLGMFGSAAGNSLESSLQKEDVKDWQTWTKAIGTGAISLVTERLGGFLAKGTPIDEVLANKISQKFANGMTKVFTRSTLKAGAEAGEEALEYTGDFLLNLGIDGINKITGGNGAEFKEEWDWEALGEQAAIGFLTSKAASGGINASEVSQIKSENKMSTMEAIDELARRQDIKAGLITDNIKQTEDIKQVDETELRRQNYQYDPIDTDSEITRELKESASRVMNNTTRSHEFIEIVSKIAEKTGTKYRFTNNQELAANNYKIEGKNINGLVTSDGVVLINIDSQKALNGIVGHETFHLVENEAEAVKLREFAKKYAETKGDYEARLQQAQELYEGLNANIENEVTADIIGDYLFTDQDFINSLSVENPNLFQKIYNEIKHWIKMATAGSKEARQLEQLKHSFEKALNSKQVSETTAESNTKYSLIDNQNRELSKEQQEYFKDSKVRDKDGNLLTMYHGTNNDFTIFDKDFIGKNTNNEGIFGKGFYFTEKKSIADGYNRKDGKVAKDGSGKTMELYLDMKNPFYWNDIDTKEKMESFINETGMPKYVVRWNNTLKNQMAPITDIKAERKFSEVLQKNGYDGVIYKYDNNVGEYVVFNSNQIKNVDNTNPTDSDDIRYSLSEAPTQDNKGRTLTKGQKEFFKNEDTTLLDKNGNLKVLYHGTPFGKFTTFKGKIFFFSEDYGFAEDYANSKSFEQALDGDINVVEAYIKAENVFDVTDPNDIQKLREAISDDINFWGRDWDKETLLKKLQRKDTLPPKWESEQIEGKKFGDYIGDDRNGYNTDMFVGVNEQNEIVYISQERDLQKLSQTEKDMFQEQLMSGKEVSYVTYQTIYGDMTKQGIQDKISELQKQGEEYKKENGFENEAIDYYIKELEQTLKWIDKDLAITTQHKLIPKTTSQESTELIDIDNWTYFETAFDRESGKDIVEIVKDLGYDAINIYESGISNYIVFNPNQIKNVTNENPTSNPDINLSLSNRNENIAPTGNYNVYGEDVKLQQAIAPLQQEIKELTETISDLKEQIAPVQEATQPTKEELDNLMALQEKGGTEYANTFFGLRDKYGQAKLYKGINEYKKSPEKYDLSTTQQNEVLEEDIAPATQESADNQALENLNTFTSEDAPVNEGAFTFDEGTTLKGKGKQNIVKDIKNNFNITMKESRDLYNKIAATEFSTVEDVYNELQAYKTFKYEQENDYYKEIKDFIKGTRLNISEIKDQITDYSNKYRMSNMGKGLILGNKGQSIDSFYEELSVEYPGVFPQDITSEIDRLNAISDFLYEDTTMTYTETIPDEILYELAQRIHADIGNNERYRGSLSQTFFFNQDAKDMLAPGEIRTEPTQTDYLKSLPDNLTENYAPYLEMAKKINAENPSNQSLTDELNRLDTFTPVVENEAQNVQNKSKGRIIKDKGTALNTLNYLLVNRNEAIDRFADEIGNQNIKFLADHVNNIAGEISTNINNAQTNNYGHAIGKSITDIFNQARKEGLSEAFNDYLFHKSNIARHSQGKGSQVPATESAVLVLEYEMENPQFKNWAFEVNEYNKNNLYKQVDAGLYSYELANKITKMYDFYVPFFEDVERIYADGYSRSIGTRGTIKRAKGGTDKNLLDFETAMMKQTQSTITAIRKNQLYKEIVESSPMKVKLGNGNGDVKALYKDENGYFVTAYENGQQISAVVNEDLYKGLENKLEQQIKDAEANLGWITKGLQGAGKLRRNLLTSWSPTFAITNPLKDIQDAPLNSKYSKDWLKNYPRALKELTTGKSELVQEFLNMYGQANLMGDYATDSGVYDVTKTAKKNNKLSKVLQANEIMELVPRYAEYLASIENGTSQMEALYNAREVTTNFGRGGVITKALNRNGFTFLNASVQGFNKLYRNFSGENGAKGVANATLKATMLGVVPALFNELAFGGDDEDEDYEALPDYIKDNYYLFKTSDGEFIRIPKGRMLSVFGSAARRTLELMQGEEDAFEGYLKNAYSQVGVQNPMESNIFAPLLQAFGSENGETWYGTDLVPSRLQDVPKEEQYDESTDKLSIWLGDKTGISPYKLNYVLDQYTGGAGDLLLPLITEEATSDAETLPEMLLAPIKDKFTANSTTDNKYVSDVYTLSDKLYKKSNSMFATDDDKLTNQYIYTITSEMGELYAERRAVQNDSNLTKAEKYRRTQAIKEEINRLAKEGLDNYQNVNKTDNYAIVGGREFNKYTTQDGEERWGSVFEDVLEEMNSLGMELEEKSEFFHAQNTISEIKSNYNDSDDYMSKKKEIVEVVKNTNLTDEQKAYLYDKYYANTDTLNAITTLGIDFNQYLDYDSQEFEADKDIYGKTIANSKKKKVFKYINSMDIDFEQKCILAKLQYNSYDEYNKEIVKYLNNSALSYEEIEALLKKMGFKVDSKGKIYW